MGALPLNTPTRFMTISPRLSSHLLHLFPAEHHRFPTMFTGIVEIVGSKSSLLDGRYRRSAKLTSASCCGPRTAG